MKLFRKYFLYKNKLLLPYINFLLNLATGMSYLAAIAFFVAFIYEHGFRISFGQTEAVNILFNWVWVIFLINITLHLLLEKRFIRKSYRRLAYIFSVLLYLTLIPAIFPNSPNEGTGIFYYLWNALDSEFYRLTLLFIFSFLVISSGLVRLLGKRTNPSLILAISFIIIIIIGTGLLMLPRSTVNGISWIDSLFMATSSVCITGLTPVDVSATFTPFGTTIIIFLIQIGGLGIMTLTSFFALFFMGNTSFYNQLVVRDMVSSESLGSLFSTLLYILGFTLAIEGVGALAIWLSIQSTMGMTLEQEISFSVFHAISAFCNAGISTMHGGLGNPQLIHGHNSLYIIISFLVILGGIGFPILVNFKDIAVYYIQRIRSFLLKSNPDRRHPPRLYNLNTRIVLIMTLLLLVSGTGLLAFFEWNNALEGMSTNEKWVQSFFNATCPRSSGFNSIDLTTLSIQSILFYILLMWIGGGSQSTAGGIKVNAFATIGLNMMAIVRGTNKVEIFGRELSADSIRRSNASMVMSFGVLFIFVFIITILEPEMSIITIVFECVSAIATVGSSLGATPLLGDTSKVFISILMFLGRVGLITLMLGIVKQKKHANYKYPVDTIIIN